MARGADVRLILVPLAAGIVGAVGWAIPYGAPALAALASAVACWCWLHPDEAGVTEDPAPEPSAEPGLAAVAASIAEPLLFVERQRVTHANAAAITLLGDHIVGEDIRLAIRQPSAAARLAAALTDGTAGPPIEVSELGGNGRIWEMTVHPLGQGGLLVRLTDRTEARAAERMRVDFVANASHELRTPLATLLGFIETLEVANGPGDAATRLRFLKTMMGEARRMQRLIEDLMSLSRIEAERHSVPQAAVALADLAAEVRDGISTAQAIERGRIVIDVAAETPPVAGDRVQLTQLLHNLIGNALKYGRPGGTVRVGIGTDGPFVRLSVADEGEGIPREHLPRLTERFYRVDPGRSRAVGGTGLGLAIVKHIVERHRGRLDITSLVGRGTTVTVALSASPGALSSNRNTIVTQDAPKPSIGTSERA